MDCKGIVSGNSQNGRLTSSDLIGVGIERIASTFGRHGYAVREPFIETNRIEFDTDTDSKG